MDIKCLQAFLEQNKMIMEHVHSSIRGRDLEVH